MISFSETVPRSLASIEDCYILADMGHLTADRNRPGKNERQQQKDQRDERETKEDKQKKQ